MAQTEIITEELVVPYEDTNDGKDHLTHFINHEKNHHLGLPGMSAKEIVEFARMTGQEVEALCGYRWVPVRNPEKYDTCQECASIASQILEEIASRRG